MPASRTPEGTPNHCTICGNQMVMEHTDPPGDVVCPRCGCHLWKATFQIPSIHDTTPVTYAEKRKWLEAELVKQRKAEAVQADRRAELLTLQLQGTEKQREQITRMLEQHSTSSPLHDVNTLEKMQHILQLTEAGQTTQEIADQVNSAEMSVRTYLMMMEHMVRQERFLENAMS